ncbi:hypothetical protein OKW32_007973 [Paraburkholderia youngii]
MDFSGSSLQQAAPGSESPTIDDIKVSGRRTLPQPVAELARRDRLPPDGALLTGLVIHWIEWTKLQSLRRCSGSG